jgi:hypothetical protein
VLYVLIHHRVFVCSDLLRSLNTELGHPINTFVTTSAVVDRILRAQALKDGVLDTHTHTRARARVRVSESESVSPY